MPMELLNVAESWPIYDTLIVSEQLYGPEQQINGWFTSFAAMSARVDHTLFKTRSEAISGLQYNNQQSTDRTDFAYNSFSIGVRMFGPVNTQEFVGVELPAANFPQDQNAILWQNVLPNHIALELRVGQDIKLTETLYHLPSGYGIMGGGSSDGFDNGQAQYPPTRCHIAFINQGVPDISNRFWFTPPLGIPRNETIEAKLYLADYARGLLNAMPGPGHFFTEEIVSEQSVYHQHPCRYGIQASLWGIREVQQRGQLHAG